MKKLIIYGTGLIAELADYYFETDSEYEVVAFCNTRKFIEVDEFLGKPIVAFEEVEKLYPPEQYSMFIALGYLKTNKIREQRFKDAKQKGYQLASYISSKATHFNTSFGDNCFILEHNVIQPFVKIMDNVTLWSGNHIGHHSTIGNNVFVASHAVVSGCCKILDNCFLGVNVTLRDNIVIGRSSVIGAGATVMKSTDSYTLVTPMKSKSSALTKDII